MRNAITSQIKGCFFLIAILTSPNACLPMYAIYPVMIINYVVFKFENSLCDFPLNDCNFKVMLSLTVAAFHNFSP